MELNVIAYIVRNDADKDHARVRFEGTEHGAQMIDEFEPKSRWLLTYGVSSETSDLSKRSKYRSNLIEHCVVCVETVETGDEGCVVVVSGAQEIGEAPVYDMMLWKEAEHKQPDEEGVLVAKSDEMTSKPEEEKEQDDPEQYVEENKGSLIVPLIIGVVFIIIAGTAFIASSWDDMNDALRVVAMGLFVAVFYGAFGISYKKLKLPSASKAFYLLGAASVALTVLVGEILLFGHDSNKPAPALILPCLIISGLSILGYFKVYRSAAFNIFAWAGGYGALLAIMAAFEEHFVKDDSFLGNLFYDYGEDGVVAFSLAALVCAVVTSVVMLKRRELPKISLVSPVVACIISWFLLLCERGTHFDISSVFVYALLASFILAVRKYPGVFLMLTIWGVMIGVVYDFHRELPEFVVSGGCAVISTALCYGMPILGRTFTPNVHNKAYWVCLAGILISMIFVMDDDYSSLIYIIPALAAMGFGIKHHLTRYIVSFGGILFFIGIIVFKDYLDSVAWWIYMLVVGAVLISFAIVNEVKHRRGESLIQKLRGSENSIWKW